jgi:hypothetical protein
MRDMQKGIKKFIECKKVRLVILQNMMVKEFAKYKSELSKRELQEDDDDASELLSKLRNFNWF